jgi:putative ABC transport system permease protein
VSLWLDLRHGVRIFLRRPGSSALLLLTLALAIGANAAIFSVVDATLFRPLPYPDPDRLVQLVTRFTGGGASGTQISHDGATWEAIRDHARDMDAAVYSGWVKGVNVATSDRAVFLRQQRVGAGFFRVLGVRPLIGREFTREEDRPDGPPVTVLAYSLWQRAFGGRTDVVGRRLTLKGEPHTIVGVMPAAFRTDADADLWTPLRASRTGEGGGANYGIVARLKPGVVRGVAEQEVAALGASVLERPREGVTARLGLTSLQKGRTGDLRQPLLIVWAAVGVVLLIGCANVAGLLLARAASRTREIATRMAIGGGRGAIIRQLLAESLLITAAGAGLGLAVGAGLVWWLGRVAEQDLLPIQAPSLDLRVVGVTVLVAAVTGLAAGLAPAIEASLVDFRTALATGGARGVAGGSRHWSRRLLVTAEIAMAVLLLVGAALLVRSVRYLNALDPGFTPDHVVAASFSLDDARYASGEKVGALFANGIARLAEVPGVESAAAGLSLPYERGLNMGARRLDGPEAGDRFLITNLTYVTPGYFAVLRIPIVEGRGLQAGDGPDNRPVAVVNEEFARQYLSRQDPVGSRLRLGSDERTVVGVVGNVQQVTSWGDYGPVGAIPAAYIPVAQTNGEFLSLVHTWFSPSWIVRTMAPPSATIAGIEQVARALDPLVPIASFHTLDELRSRSLAWERFQALLLGSLSGLALLLAVTGIYGLMAQSVQERRRELGLRLALGASLGRALRDAVAPGVTMALAGVGLGVVGAAAVSGVLRHLLWGVTAADPATYAVVAAGLLAVAVLASVVPALAIARLDPSEALRDL